MVEVPVLIKGTFWKVFFIDGGLLASIETNTPTNRFTTKQSGLGFEMGTGLQYNLGPIRVFVNPYLQAHNIITFASGNNHFDVLNSGYKFGLGYNF